MKTGDVCSMYEKRDCRVASLLAMTKREVMTLPALCIGKDGLDESSPYKLQLTLTLPSPLKGEGKRNGFPPSRE